MAVVTLTQVKTHLNITTTSDDTELTFFAGVATALVQGHADRIFEVTSLTQTFDGGTDTFVLRTSPLTTVTSVTVSGTALAAATYVADLQNGIVRTLARQPAGFGTVVIAFTVGSTDVPDLIEQATLEAVRHLWETQRGKRGGRQPREGDEYVPGTGYSLPRRVEELLDSLRNVS